MLAKYLLILALVVNCWAEDETIISTASLTEGGDSVISVNGEDPLILSNLAASLSNPYSSVAKCSDNLVKKALTEFNINELANTGGYKYLYSTGLGSTKCAEGTIYGDDEIGFRATASLTDKKGKSSKVLYELLPNEDGTIDETLTLDDGNEYNFVVVPLAWEKKTGVLYYGRCSTEGTSKTESRSIVVSQCNSNNSKAKSIADSFAKRDSSGGFKGDKLAKFTICN
uniref:Lipocalin/cytosolic fatty-acid binding domain-containing protein n=1 Tax=Clastoptera arizonana TaxID=38151 RepID=A0A1B6DN33_9HEMI